VRQISEPICKPPPNNKGRQPSWDVFFSSLLFFASFFPLLTCFFDSDLEVAFLLHLDSKMICNKLAKGVAYQQAVT